MLLMFGAFMMNAQNIPSTLNYQAVVRNNQNQVIPSQSVKFKFSVIDNGGISVCSEEVSLNTSAIGLVDHKIGTINTTGFANINWKSAKKIKVEIDINNGTNYVNMGDIDLQSVPFANVAKDLEVSGTTIGQVLKWNGSKWVPDTDNVGNGIPGPQGPAGPTGAQGPIGLTGPAGGSRSHWIDWCYGSNRSSRSYRINRPYRSNGGSRSYWVNWCYGSNRTTRSYRIDWC